MKTAYSLSKNILTLFYL